MILLSNTTWRICQLIYTTYMENLYILYGLGFLYAKEILQLRNNKDFNIKFTPFH